MITIEEINAMTPEERAKLQKKLVRKIVLTRIVAPLAAVAVVHIGIALWEKKHPTSTED
jgi:hypothetical protein